MKGLLMNKRKTVISLLALAAMTAEASAADLCNAQSAAALKTAAIQQELMVAGFTCGAGEQYNSFVRAWQSDLQNSDAALKAYFRSRDHGKEAGYDSYKTKAANLSAYRSATDGARYCASTASAFAAASRSPSLKDFVANEPLMIAVPEACAVRYDTTQVAGVPSYQLPAAPYGARPASRGAYNDPPPESRDH